MDFTGVRDRRQTSAWDAPSATPPSVPVSTFKINFASLQKYITSDQPVDEDLIRAELGIPSKSLYPPHDRVLEGNHVVIVLMKEPKGVFYYVENYTVREDSKKKKKAFMGQAAKDEKTRWESYLCWTWGCKFLRRFIPELGGTSEIISEPKDFPKPRDLIFVMGPFANPNISKPHVGLGAEMHASIPIFIERQQASLKEIRERAVTPSAVGSEEGEDSLSEMNVNIKEDKNPEGSGDGGEDNDSDAEGLWGNSDEGETPIHSPEPGRATSSSAPPITPNSSPAAAVDDVVDKVSQGEDKDEEPSRGVVRNKKRVVSDEKAKDIEVGHGTKKGKEE
ncbi:hypothetical protein I302_103751 [Kwoniella bestiolae CBS 10118]|uniref:Uncharacterized protein n=1 Tax=Kwoniella bestiolae CBS 10118 TaxID=1296100 RepID=A0A1B9G9E0_9TREE|nr:hypothetical protein I302_02454 [Kwoniella bestiolae CBS 10118]OCF27611.1 hypothetical protein I302_02454 [Kwoniella bestiolae CBS 10118]